MIIIFPIPRKRIISTSRVYIFYVSPPITPHKVSDLDSIGILTDIALVSNLKNVENRFKYGGHKMFIDQFTLNWYLGALGL